MTFISIIQNQLSFWCFINLQWDLERRTKLASWWVACWSLKQSKFGTCKILYEELTRLQKRKSSNNTLRGRKLILLLSRHHKWILKRRNRTLNTIDTKSRKTMKGSCNIVSQCILKLNQIINVQTRLRIKFAPITNRTNDKQWIDLKTSQQSRFGQQVSTKQIIK